MMTEQARHNAIIAQEYGAECSKEARATLEFIVRCKDILSFPAIRAHMASVRREQDKAADQYIVQRYCRDYDE